MAMYSNQFQCHHLALTSKHCVDLRLLGITSLTSTSSMSMEPTQSPPSETEVHSSEDFVHGEEDSKPTGDMSSSESIVNVEKEDLLDDGAVVEEAHDDSDSVVSGGDAPAAGDDGDGECSPEVLELLEELVKSGAMLTCDSTAETGSCYVLLIGTSHVSEESCRVVKAVISYLKPEAVLVELCSSRVSLLQPQTLKIASEFGVFPGSEFRVAYEEACKYGGKVMLVDRPIQITLKRTWAKMPLWHKVKFVYTLMFQDVFLPSSEEHGKRPQEMETADSMTLLIEELSKEFPSLIETLVYERDRYMATALLDIASGCNLVVAVIGNGHINGIKKNWKQPVSIEDLMEIPGDGSVFTVKRIVSSVAIAVAGTAIFTGILLARRR
ncbi:BnaAnng16300D [Brassica napus]|uniref:BnaAnng16300D protein n=1 Tax=Brassica napus TaxID=3708 RepID=A0A078J295_BRANA|nr:BnaAnng16300D [Brassica napus]